MAVPRRAGRDRVHNIGDPALLQYLYQGAHLGRRMLYTCLFAWTGTDLRKVLRSGGTEEEIVDLVRGIWEARRDRYSEIRSEATVGLPKVEMSYIGG